MFYFDPKMPEVLFGDIRSERHVVNDKSSRSGQRSISICPDEIMDFTNLPFEDDHFHMVVFDPPHLLNPGPNGWMALKYGALFPGWEDMIRSGFEECFRVLKPMGTLVFKWNETDIPVSKVLELTPHTPIVGNRCGKSAKTHWLVFMKLNYVT